MAAANNNVGPTAPVDGEGEDEIVGESHNPQQTPAQKREEHTQTQLDEVVGIMKNNVETALEYGHKLSDLDDRVRYLHHDASQFEQQTAKFKEDSRKKKTKAKKATD